MLESRPNQRQILNWMLVFSIEKLNQSVQDKDWSRVSAILNIARAVTECMKEIEV